MVTLNTTADESRLNFASAIQVDAYRGNGHTAAELKTTFDRHTTNTFNSGAQITLEAYTYTLGATGKQLGHSLETRNNQINAQESARNAGTGIASQMTANTENSVAAAQMSKAYEFLAKQAQAAKDSGKLGLS